MPWLLQQFQDYSLIIAVICGGFLILSMGRHAWLNWLIHRSSVAKLSSVLALICVFIAALWVSVVVQGWFRPSWPQSLTLGPEVGEKTHPHAGSPTAR